MRSFVLVSNEPLENPVQFDSDVLLFEGENVNQTLWINSGIEHVDLLQIKALNTFSRSFGVHLNLLNRNFDFSWPCLYQWLETRPNVKTCPVCKAGISRDKVIPVYGRDSDGKDPRNKLPPRPSGQRSEPENSSVRLNVAVNFSK